MGHYEQKLECLLRAVWSIALCQKSASARCQLILGRAEVHAPRERDSMNIHTILAIQKACLVSLIHISAILVRLDKASASGGHRRIVVDAIDQHSERLTSHECATWAEQVQEQS